MATANLINSNNGCNGARFITAKPKKAKPRKDLWACETQAIRLADMVRATDKLCANLELRLESLDEDPGEASALASCLKLLEEQLLALSEDIAANR